MDEVAGERVIGGMCGWEGGGLTHFNAARKYKNEAPHYSPPRAGYSYTHTHTHTHTHTYTL